MSSNDTPLIEFRCTCGRLLFKVSELTGVEVEVRCPRCKKDMRGHLALEDEPAEPAPKH